MRGQLATRTLVARLGLALLVVVAAALAISLHRNGHTQGDDFALYLRQARSLFDGDVGAVVADNRFSVLWSDGPFSPIAYPWGWPLILSPFVHLWGLDYDRLKLVEVALFCVWLVIFHGIVRRRIGRMAALALVAVFATAPFYLAHTDQLLSEFPHLVAVAAFVWWYDRIRRRSTLLDAPVAELVVLGCFVTVAFNMRREALALLGVIAVMQAYDAIRARRLDLRPLLTPYVSFAVSAVLFQLLLPTALFPDNGNDLSYVDDRLGELPANLSDHVGLGTNTTVGNLILVVAAIGIVAGVRRRPALDLPLVALAVCSTLAIGTHLREVPRYWMQVTPWIAYFVVVALTEAAGALLAAADRRAAPDGGIGDRGRDAVRVAALVPLLLLVGAHVGALSDDVRAARDYNDAGRVQSGPTNPLVAPIFVAVDELTPPDAIVAYYRARTMTLLTDRRSFQTKNLERIHDNADYFAQRRNSTYWQPNVSRAEAVTRGWEEVWASPTWVLWRIPDEPPD